jgi:putative transcriptional regulator
MKPIEIRELRQKLGLTQTQFALALGCKKGTIENYEQAKRKPSEVFEERLEKLRKKAAKMKPKLDAEAEKE